MPLDLAAIVGELKEVLREAQEALGDSSSMSMALLEADRASEAVALCRSAIERYTPEDSSYRRQVVVLAKTGTSIGAAQKMCGALAALIKDYEKGRLRSFEELVHADVTGDFIGQADQLSKQGFKDAAMVIAGSVLEQHLRQLAVRHGISIFAGGRHKKAEQMNVDLCKKGAYGLTEQKTVTAWLGRRNEAAHGQYDAYDHREVKHVIDGVQGFLTRFPA